RHFQLASYPTLFLFFSALNPPGPTSLFSTPFHPLSSSSVLPSCLSFPLFWLSKLPGRYLFPSTVPEVEFQSSDSETGIVVSSGCWTYRVLFKGMSLGVEWAWESQDRTLSVEERVTSDSCELVMELRLEFEMNEVELGDEIFEYVEEEEADMEGGGDVSVLRAQRLVVGVGMVR
ncbi:hypothetical protein BCR34DRAFT_638371, partial [Clohesyomyces aquaticus]